MGKIELYRSYIMDILEDYAKTVFPVNLQRIENQVLADTIENHYVLISFGWEQRMFSYTVIFHFDIKPDGKIWLQANNTDRDVAEDLELMGVPSSDIVIGFQPQDRRQLTRYAVI